jgi:4-hydroxy-2-oxoheptanedioate aldolase
VGGLANPKFIEICALHGGFHGVWIDQEHAGLTQSQIESLTLACRAAGMDSFVRLAPTDYATVMRPMEAGAGGVMAAQVHDAEQVRQVVDWAKYPPIGHRGLNISNYEGGWATRDPAEFIAESNRDRWLAIQIETAGALEEVEQIAAIEQVDHLFIGPADLSVSLGVPGQYLHPKCVEAIARVAEAAKASGKTWGILPRGPEHAAKCAELGCLLFAFATDLGVVNLGFQAAAKVYADFFGEQ